MTKGTRGALRLVGAVSFMLGVSTAQRVMTQHRELHDAAAFETAPRQLAEQEKSADDADPEDATTPDEATVDDLVTAAMPGLSEKIDLVHHAGRISLDKSKRNNIFYWHFAAATSAETAPLVIWLNGGPGCTSMQGLLLGIAPFRIETGTTLSINKHSWHHHANLLFIDQPVGTGMSLTRGNDLRTDEETIAQDFHTVITQFFARHPEYLSAKNANGLQTSRDIYIFGESHAGRFIPQFSDYIVSQNRLLVHSKTGGIHVSLRGVGIGNGWVHPFIQYDYSDFAHGLGLVTFGQVRALKAAYADCQNALSSGKFLTMTCFDNMNTILDSVRNSKSLNYYDVREYVANVRAYPSQRKAIGEYMNQMQVRELLHANTASSFQFKGCSDQVYNELQKFDGVSTLETVERLLQGGLRVLFYNGQWDMMCHHVGTEKLLLHLDWNGSTAYQEANKYTWVVTGRSEPAGFAQEGGNLSYVVIANAGHMVPLDAPDVAAEMVRRFINNQRFDDTVQSVKSFATNRTNYETTQCVASLQQATPSASKKNGVSLTWFWIAVVVAVVGSLLVCCVSVLCRRGRNKARHSEHSIVIQESDEEDEQDDDGEDDSERRTARGGRESDPESDEELTEVAIRSRG